MPDFIFQETGLAQRLETYVPEAAKRVYFPTADATASIHRDPIALDRELHDRWGERGDAAAFRADEARVVSYLQHGYRTGTPPNVDRARRALGDALTDLWITGSAKRLLDHYFTAERTKIYFAMTVTESGPVGLDEPGSAFTIPMMDSGSVFEGYYGFVKPGLWRLLEELALVNAELGVVARLGATVERVDTAASQVRFTTADRATETLGYDHLVLATDPLTAARLTDDHALIARIETARLLGSSGKVTLFFDRPVQWRDNADDTAFRFIFATETLAEFERTTQAVTTGSTLYQPGYIQIYCEGASMRRLGLVEPFDRLALFFKNAGLGVRGADAPEVRDHVTEQVLAHVANPEACAWRRLLMPSDLKELFLFPGGNIDHTELVGGQTFATRGFADQTAQRFYQFGPWPTVSYCGAGAYPCGSIAGTPGYMCAIETRTRVGLRGS